MTSQSLPSLNLMLVDADAAFRQGLIACLRPYANLQVVLEADSRATARIGLQSPPARSLDLVVLSLDFEAESAGSPGAIALCQEIHTRYPHLPILVMSTHREAALLTQALQAGAKGYIQKGSVVADLVIAIQQVAAGRTYWDQGMETIVQALSQPPAIAPAPATPRSPLQRNLSKLRQTARTSGLQQIDRAIANLNQQLTEPTLSQWDALFLAGRRRELRAARWLVQQMLSPAASLGDRPPQIPPAPPPPAPPPPPTAIAPQPQPTSLRSLQGALFDTLFTHIQAPLRNLTEAPLEIDILRDDKKRELLTVILKRFEALLDELRFAQLDLAQLLDKSPTILLNLWEDSTVEFFGRYATLTVGSSPTEQYNQPEIAVVDVMLRDAPIVEAEILSKIPLFPDILAHLLFQTPLMVDDAACNVGTVEAMGRLELILQNVLLQVANGVVQPLLNRFGDVVVIKQNFYDRRLLSSREIEKFRNNLSWKYRVQRLFKEPTAIFESRYDLLRLQAGGITQTAIYSPRNQELDTLSGSRLAVTLALEARDAIAPRLQAAIAFVGSGVVYVLTEVVGRGIGLIGRGIIKGIGTALQDVKFNRGNSGSSGGDR